MEYEDRVLLVRRLMNKHGLKVRAARRKNDFMSLKEFPLDSKGYIHKIFSLKKIFENSDQIRSMVVPFEEKMLTLWSH